MFDPAEHPDLLIGLDGPDDAAVWKLSEDKAIVITTDFFTPVVDDPYDYGAIAATNSLSDIYAMGGKPFLALNIAAFPGDLPVAVMSEILRGGAETCKQAGVVVAGGHTVQDKEPKFGLVVLGFVDPQKMITKSGAMIGDSLFITKPLGVGILTTALKRGLLDEDQTANVSKWMSTKNATAGDLAVEFGVKCGTDITGFGLLGHSFEMAQSSGVGFSFSSTSIPMLPGAVEFAKDWIFPGGSMDNKLHYESSVQFDETIEDYLRMLLFDAQTSGGLLLCVSPNNETAFVERAQQLNQPVWKIGKVYKGKGIRVTK